MALGEFVSVYVQYDTEMSQLKREMMGKNGGDEKTIDEQAMKKKNRLPTAEPGEGGYSIGHFIFYSVGLVVLGGVGAVLGGAPDLRSSARVFL
ncbi:hypothetical protein ACLB2K_060894 [Fragaria x ananassa]